MTAPTQDPEDEDLPPSKTRRKNESHALQDLGEDLVQLGLAKFKGIEMPDTLRDAIEEVRRVKSHEGKRRQMQFIGKWMRKLDEPTVAAIAAIIEASKRPSREEVIRMHRLEQWRDTLVDDDTALAQWLTHYPATDVQHIRSLIRSARKEQRTDATVRAGRAYRELFQLLKDLAGAGQAQAAAGAAAAPSPNDDHNQDAE
jgi:ribosome-associated protein